MRAPSLLLVLVLLPLVACNPPRGGVHVVVDGPLVPGADFDRLTVVASLKEGPVPLAMASLEGAELKLPATFNFESGPSTPEGTQVLVRATAERAGVVQATAFGEATLTGGSGASLTLTLPALAQRPDAGTPREVCDNGLDDDSDGQGDCADPDCEGASCLAGGLTCQAGACGCAGRPAGTTLARPGFSRRTQPQAVVPGAGPFAGALVVAGGRDELGVPSREVDIYFPETNQRQQGSFQVGRAEASLVALPDGGVGILGGVSAGGQAEPSLEWLTQGAAFSRLFFSPRLTARGAIPGLLGADVLLAGGALSPDGGTPASNLAVRVAPGETGATVTSLGRLSLACPAGGAPLGGGFVLAGGCAGTGASERTDVVSPLGTLGTGPRLPVALEAPAVVSLPGGRALVAGGREPGPGGGLVPSARAFLLESSGEVVRVRELLPLDAPRAQPRAVRAGNGWVYLEDAAGGAPVWFDPISERFTPAVALPGARREHALAGGLGGRVFAAGGTGPDGGLDDSVAVVELSCP
jgi:hypothetical protein